MEKTRAGVRDEGAVRSRDDSAGRERIGEDATSLGFVTVEEQASPLIDRRPNATVLLRMAMVEPPSVSLAP